MSGLDKIKIDESFMDTLAGKYDDCGTAIADIEALFAELWRVLEANYTGQGEALAHEAVEKLSEHFALLGMCTEQAGRFVRHTKENFAENERRFLWKFSPIEAGGVL